MTKYSEKEIAAYRVGFDDGIIWARTERDRLNKVQDKLGGAVDREPNIVKDRLEKWKAGDASLADMPLMVKILAVCYNDLTSIKNIGEDKVAHIAAASLNDWAKLIKGK
jgi:hypothetical protein